MSVNKLKKVNLNRTKGMLTESLNKAPQTLVFLDVLWTYLQIDEHRTESR
jgi:hypothetical protein